MLFSFDKLLNKCLSHEVLISNRLRESRMRTFFPSLTKIFTLHSTSTFKEIKKNDRHFHLLSEKERLILEKSLKKHYLPRQLSHYLNNLEVFQMSLDEKEGRMIGIIQQINNSVNHPERNHLFSPLIFDFEHSFHPNLRKKKLKGNSLVCIMEERNCSNY